MGGDPDAGSAGMVDVTGPGDGVRLLLTVLLAGWAMAYAYSLLEVASAESWASYLTLDFQNESSLHFLGWQGIAGVIALAVYGVSRLWPRGAAARQLGNLPLLLAVLMMAALAAVVMLDDMPA